MITDRVERVVRGDVDVDALPASEIARGVETLDRDRHAAQLRSGRSRGHGADRHQLARRQRPCQGPAHRRSAAGAEVGAGCLPEPHRDGFEVVGAHAAPGGEVTGHRPHVDGVVGGREDPGAEHDGQQNEQHAAQQAGVAPTGPAESPRRG